MSGMILCRTKEAEKPYIIRQMGIRLFSLEELSYFLYNNIYIINADFFDDSLLSFIEKDTEEKNLSDRLRFLKSQGAGLAELVVTVLKFVDYYSDEEIEKLKDVLAVLDTQNVYERIKTRGDGFLHNERFYSAIMNYLNIIEGKPDNSLSGLFYAKVYHNTGVAFARLFHYSEAKKYFDIAYKIGQHDESKKSAIACEKMSQTEGVIEKDDATKEELEVKRQIETLMDNARYCDEYRRLADIEKQKTDGDIQKYNDNMSDMIQDWKNDYLRYIS